MPVAPAREPVRVETPHDPFDDRILDGHMFDRRGTPCAFAGCSGFLHAARGSTGVVLCAPWGFEELAQRRAWRRLAESIAAAGYPCLRFDYPGTGDSLGHADDPCAIADWMNAIDTAIDYLRGNAGVRRLILVGQSLGAALATEVANRRDDVIGLHLLTPVVDGRTYLADLFAQSRHVDERLGLTQSHARPQAPCFAGFSMGVTLVESLKALDLRALDHIRSECVVVYDRLDRRESAQAVERMRRLAPRVEVQAAARPPLSICDAAISQSLPVEAGHLVAKLAELHPVFASQQPAPARMLPSALNSEAFKEQPIEFGSNESFFGVFCRPAHERAETPAVLLLDGGRLPHVGWGRGAVDRARALAIAGIASLRIDLTGIGDSGDMAQGAAYPDAVRPCISAAIDVLAARGHRRIVLAGVSTGAQLALTAAHGDPRITDIVAANPPDFVWRRSRYGEGPVGARAVPHAVGIRARLEEVKAFGPVLTRLATRSIRRAMAHLPMRLRALLLRDPLAARVQRFFGELGARRSRVSLVYGAGDPGLIELRTYFGPNGIALTGPDCTVSIVPEADHHMTSPAAAAWLLDHLIDVAWAGRRREARPATAPIRESQPAVCLT